ncbi:MAG TPA: hypothetical protein H9903_18255 [Candidatus Aquabacterium excrementipullorum]|nr:hypothetical protein [Candidatus Aquabacterium excrementipullorum]
MSLPQHPWHQFWTRSLDAATGVAGSAESLPGLTTQWWTQSMQASQQWWSWWFAAFMPPAGWGAQDPVGQVPPPAAESARPEPVRRSAPRPALAAEAPVRRPKVAAKHARKG